MNIIGFLGLEVGVGGGGVDRSLEATFFLALKKNMSIQNLSSVNDVSSQMALKAFNEPGRRKRMQLMFSVLHSQSMGITMNEQRMVSKIVRREKNREYKARLLLLGKMFGAIVGKRCRFLFLPALYQRQRHTAKTAHK